MGMCAEGQLWGSSPAHLLCPLPAFLSWFRNGLLASGIGVISFMQSDMGREAAYGEYSVLLGHLLVPSLVLSVCPMGSRAGWGGLVPFPK